MVELEQRGAVWVLRMRDDENRFNRRSVDELHAALDKVESQEGPVALVTTGEGKFYSNGLDLDWLVAGGPDTAGFIDDVHRLLGRVLGFGAVTVAAVNGHAFAGGAMLASAHDHIVMRNDRGFWCLPEVDLGLPLTPAMHAVLAAHLPPRTLAEAALTGRRYSAPEALVAGIINEAAKEKAVLERAVAHAESLATKNRDVIKEHKRLMYGDALRICALGSD
jgi:enoyl-CoA hydratase/carnithine racemase